jgi:hypothetical protein
LSLALLRCIQRFSVVCVRKRYFEKIRVFQAGVTP